MRLTSDYGTKVEIFHAYKYRIAGYFSGYKLSWIVQISAIFILTNYNIVATPTSIIALERGHCQWSQCTGSSLTDPFTNRLCGVRLSKESGYEGLAVTFELYHGGINFRAFT